MAYLAVTIHLSDKLSDFRESTCVHYVYIDTVFSLVMPTVTVIGFVVSLRAVRIVPTYRVECPA